MININNSPLADAITNPTLSENIRDLSGIEYLQLMLPNFITIILIIGLIIFFFVFLFGAIQWITSGGDKAGMEAARTRLTNAFIGIVILFSAFAVTRLVEVFFGVSIFEIDFNPLIIE